MAECAPTLDFFLEADVQSLQVAIQECCIWTVVCCIAEHRIQAGIVLRKAVEFVQGIRAHIITAPHSCSLSVNL